MVERVRDCCDQLAVQMQENSPDPMLKKLVLKEVQLFAHTRTKRTCCLAKNSKKTPRLF
jgi:hypothetical protein